MTTVALVSDLMDRSKIGAALADVAFASDPAGCAGADVVIVDVGGHADAVADLRQLAPDAHIVAFGRHDNPDALARARADGADVAVPRSRFFRDPAAVVGPP
jgi:DNA-binding NarL/FixJ family response regulator